MSGWTGRRRALKLTKDQQTSLRRLYLRLPEPRPSFLAFRRGVEPTIGCDGAVMVWFCNMAVGIERDGYTHT